MFMGPVKILLAPIRRVLHFPLVQLALTVAVIVWLQVADESSLRGQAYVALDRLVEFVVHWCAETFGLKSFTRAWVTTGLWIACVYLAGLVILYLLKAFVVAMIELVAQHNVLYLRNAIARERGIDAYRAWLPLERIRPANISQQTWEETFAWPPDNKPPYPPLAHRAARVAMSYAAVLLIAAVLLQQFTPLPVLTWIGNATKMLVARP
jgi:hypothetical protein